MKPNPILFIFVLVLVGCHQQNKKQDGTDNLTPHEEGISIVTRLYNNSATAVEYEIPVITGTNVRHGVQKRYYRHGSLYSSVPYVAGKRNGIAYTYYPVAGKAEPVVWKEQPYVGDKLEGICKRYHRDGKLQAEYGYMNGMPSIGLKEYYQSGKQVKHPDLILNKTKTKERYYITAHLSDGSKDVDYFMGDLVEGKYLPENLKGLQVVNGKGEILVSLDTKKVTITAVKFTKYKNRYIISKSITL